MATVSTSRRSLAGIVLIVAGALFLLGVLLPYLNISAPWLFGLGYLALAAALAILAFGAVNSNIAKIALIAGAVGWLLLAIAAFTAVLPAGVIVFGAILGGFGLLVGAIVLYVGKEVTNISAIAFIAAGVLAVLFVLSYTGTLALGALATIVTVLFAVALIITGIYFRRVGPR